MIKPQKPKNEIQRVQALHNLHILDTNSEERFDSIIHVAQHLFHVPMALVSLVDTEREWFKSRCGFQLKETPRDISFGAHVILQEDIMIVKDSLNDVRFSDNPLVIGEPDIRFYLGCPLKTKDRFNIGTLCLIDQKPQQQYNGVDLGIIKDLATMVESELETMRLSTRDKFTQLFNRQGFLITGKKIINLGNQYDKNILLLYFDLHKLKFINKNYGYDEGDKILKIFSQQLLKSFRHTDAIARVGGDKFCVLCSGMSMIQVTTVIKRFQNKLSAVQSNYPIEFNMGTIQYDRLKHYSIGSLIEEADEKIYEYKRH
ncbi:sensor domain-containing diguanylate cyclase [Legionella drancourtii]|uniref:GGDEF domain-containing protein n=1 Tax=Legionella drancourtii LLAP12 TaxID=658187 RepID=G9ERK2_9GAMM|nr:sensor domain-containing diguanylate cyclase [Legionella drancourtii]EHL30171.1 hypothetical protein LDG_7917 [Legionella drancourtii LLAP12]